MTVDMAKIREDYERMQAEEAAMKKAREERGDRPKVDQKHYWRPKQGANKVRIIPVPGNDKPYKEFRQAWINRKPIVPPSTVDPSADCVFKDHLAKLREVPGEKGKNDYLNARDKPVAGCFIIDRAEPEKGPQSWTMKQRELQQLMAILFDAEAGDIFDVNEGRDISVTYDKGNKNGAITINPVMSTSPLGDEDQIAEWTSVDLWAAYRVGEATENDYIQAIIDGKVSEYWDQKKAEWKAKQEGRSDPAPEADPVAAPEHTTAGVADEALDALADLAPKFFVKDPATGNTLPEPMTLAAIKLKFGPDTEVQDQDMSGWKPLKEIA